MLVEIMKQKEIYRELYNTVKRNFANEQMSRFFPLQGERYNESTRGDDTEKNVRLMIIGRSVNGWTGLSEKTAEEFSENAAKAMLQNGFTWLRDDGQGVETYIREDGKECRYNINRSSFFRATKRILNRIKPETAPERRWFEHIVWSNLYVIAPLHSGNAEGKLQDIQLNLSKELLLLQIAFYNPTHILFITDWEFWFERFADVFPDVNKVGNSVDSNVVGYGKFENAKVVVSIRPDRTRPNRPNKIEFANDIVARFEEY